MLKPGCKVLVTGGSGFVGSNLVERFISEGFQVRNFDLIKPKKNVSGDFEHVHGDICSKREILSAMNGCKAVFHLAADPKLWRKKRSYYHLINNIGARTVLDAGLESKLDLVVHISTESILTSRKHHGEIGENQLVGVQDSIGAYCRSKMRAELYALGLGKKGAPVLVVNPTLPIGPGDYGLCPPSRMIIDVCNNGRREFIEGDLNLADVRDIANGILLAARMGEPGRRYILSGHNRTIEQVFGIIAKLRNLPRPDRKISYFFALAFAVASEFWSDFVSGEQPQANVTGVLLTRRIMRFKEDVALRKAGWQIRPLEESLVDALVWFENNGFVRKMNM